MLECIVRLLSIKACMNILINVNEGRGLSVSSRVVIGNIVLD